VGALAAVGVVEAAVTIVRCSRRLPPTKYRHQGQETWTICLVVVAVYWEQAGAQVAVPAMRRAPNLPIVPLLYITPRQVSAVYPITCIISNDRYPCRVRGSEFCNLL